MKYYKTYCDACGVEKLQPLYRKNKTSFVACSNECVALLNTKHGLSHSRVYRIWTSMLARTTNPNHRHYQRYCRYRLTSDLRWDKFANFFADMGQPPSTKHSLDRINNTLGYSKGNCRWATAVEQANNTSRTPFITHDGVTRSLADWARHLNLPHTTIQSRLIRGFSTERILHPSCYNKFGHKLFKGGTNAQANLLKPAL